MAWWDFIKEIRLDQDEERKRRQQGGVKNRAFGFLDDILDTGQAVGNYGIERGKDVAGIAAGIGREVVVKPARTAIMSVEEKQQDYKKANQLSVIDKLKGMGAEERKKFIEADPLLKRSFKDGKLEFTETTDPWMFGNKLKDKKVMANIDPTDDSALEKLRQQIEEKDLTNDVANKNPSASSKVVFGNEPIKTYQERERGLEHEAGWAKPFAVAGTAVNALLDAPTGGIGTAAKSIGKGGFKALARAEAPELIEPILKKAGMADDVIKKIAPTIANLTDEVDIRKVVNAADTGIRQRVVRPVTDRLGRTNPIDDLVSAARPADDALNINPLERPARRFTDDILEPATPAGTPPVPPTIPKRPGEPKYGDDADEILGLFKSSSEIEKAQPSGGFKEKAYQQFFDKLAPVNRLVKTVETTTGRKLATEENPYELMRLYSGMPAQVKQRVGEVTDAIEQSGDVDALRVLGTARRILGRPDIKSTITPERATNAIDQLHTKLGDEGFDRVNKAVDSIVGYNETLLKELGDAGVLAPDAVQEIIQKNPDYFARFQVVNKLLEGAGRDIFHSGGSYNLSRQNVVKAMKGMEEGTEILDPLESIVKATDLSMRTIAKNRIWQSMDSLADEAPDLIKRVRDPENVAERIALSLDNKAMRPIRNKLDRLVTTRGRWARQLQSQIDQLEKTGLNKSLKAGGQAPTPRFDVGGLGGAVPTSKTANKVVPESAGEKGLMEAMGGGELPTPQKLGPKDTGAFVRSLIEGPNKEIVRLKKMVANREPKLATLLDDIQGLKGEYDDVGRQISANSDRAKNELADLDIPDGYDVVGGFKNGVGGRLAIPKEIADVYKGMTPSQMNYLTKIVGGVNRVMKESVTSLSLPFAFIRNPIRDFKAMATNSNNIPSSVHKLVGAWTKGFASALKHDDMYERWIKAGGGGAGIYGNMESAEDLAKGLSRKVNGITINGPGDIAKEAWRWGTAPIRGASNVIQKAGATLEAAPRLAEFTAATKKGLSDEAAALASRNVTVDFHQSGTVGQVMNQWIPFLNARLQGNKKLLEAAKRNPVRFAGVYTTLTAVPLIATAAYNQQHSDVLEQIPQSVKDNNFLIILGDDKDADGNFTQIVKIPKGDMDKIFGNPLENFINFAAKNDTKGFGQVVTEMLGNVSPVDITKDGKLNLSRTVGGVLPVALKVPAEQATNHNLYFDAPIVPESMQDLPNDQQVKEDTSGVAKFLSGLTGSSPMKTEQAVRSTTGQLLTSNPAGELGKSVAGANDTAPTNEFYKILKSTSKDKAGTSAKINDAIADNDFSTAMKLANDYNERLKNEFSPWAQRYGKYATPELQQMYNDQKLTLSRRSVKQRYKNQLEKATSK